MLAASLLEAADSLSRDPIRHLINTHCEDHRVRSEYVPRCGGNCARWCWLPRRSAKCYRRHHL